MTWAIGHITILRNVFGGCLTTFCHLFGCKFTTFRHIILMSAAIQKKVNNYAVKIPVGSPFPSSRCSSPD